MFTITFQDQVVYQFTNSFKMTPIELYFVQSYLNGVDNYYQTYFSPKKN